MDGLIKSLLFSDRNITPKNMKFTELKNVLLSPQLEQIIEKKNGEMLKILTHYKNQIDADPQLENTDGYLLKVSNVRKRRAEKVLSGNIEHVVKERLKTIYTDKELEETKKDRGYKHFKVRNETLEVGIMVKEDLMQLIELYKLDAISNIITTYDKFPSYKLEKWFEDFKMMNKLAYGKIPQKEKGRLVLGENSYKSEEVLLFHCLTDDHIYLIKRIHMKF